ncbi:chemotaxis protein CheB [Desulfobacter curvatus]|uniref:chemotaxis protein CheB n=1 Tax=Desulfobacter curvatus TaxID=2290 RepID=UPI00037892D4|nr:chemotaxis protein CheB [Desulfobacter curvatus]
MPLKEEKDVSLPQSKSKSQTTRKKEATGNIERKSPPQLFPVVGLGASAGGLEALKAFFAKVPPKSGMAFIVLVHMAPNQPSLMQELLQKISSIPVSTAEDATPLEPNRAYIIPPNKDISIYNGNIQLLDMTTKRGLLPIDFFFRSLAQDQGNHAAAIVLSGMGTDGTLGIKEIKVNDGLVFVQSEDSAGYDGMPRSAINTGIVDMIMAPADMPEKLIQYFSHAVPRSQDTPAGLPFKEESWIHKIYAILRSHVGHDFSSYKLNTILRRINRRMSLNHISRHEIYVRYLRENPEEIDALFRELLIGVTNFFRDPESFEVLKTDVLPDLLGSLRPDATFRAWIPGCSTGEEVYSLAIILKEVLDKNPNRINLQIFGTDIDNRAISKAREGVYPFSIKADLGEERVNRFFIKEGDFYRIRKEIRDCVVFSVQNIIKDPPFSRLNLMCCRNLLIYLNSDAQKKLLPLFHYTLTPGGVLMLGSSETIGGATDLFQVINKKWRIFRRQEVSKAMRHLVNFPTGPLDIEHPKDSSVGTSQIKTFDSSYLTQKVVLEQFAPTAVLTNTDGDIINIQGRTGKYLETPSGPLTNNLLDMAREGLRIELSAALRAAGSSGVKVTKRRLSVKTNGDYQLIDLHVCPLKKPDELAGRLLVVFEDIKSESLDEAGNLVGKDASSLAPPRITELERELQTTRESHQTTIEELESSNEELKSTNEEIQSANEELQSTNEELESSKEELQSLNEELQTVNAELQGKVEELSAAHDDMRNLLNSTEIANIFVDNNMRVRRFTPEATMIINLIQTDIGRPIQHVVSNLKYGNMIKDLENVLQYLTPVETEVQTNEDKWFNMRIIPYRTTDNRIDGAVMTFTSIEDQKKVHSRLETSLKEAENAWELVRAIFDISEDPKVVLDVNSCIVIANNCYMTLMDIDRKYLTGTDFIPTLKIVSSQKETLGTQLKAAMETNKDFISDMISFETASGEKKYTIKGTILKGDKNCPYRILLQFIPEQSPITAMD